MCTVQFRAMICNYFINLEKNTSKQLCSMLNTRNAKDFFLANVLLMLLPGYQSNGCLLVYQLQGTRLNIFHWWLFYFMLLLPALLISQWQNNNALTDGLKVDSEILKIWLMYSKPFTLAICFDRKTKFTTGWDQHHYIGNQLFLWYIVLMDSKVACRTSWSLWTRC